MRFRHSTNAMLAVLAHALRTHFDFNSNEGQWASEGNSKRSRHGRTGWALWADARTKCALNHLRYLCLELCSHCWHVIRVHQTFESDCLDDDLHVPPVLTVWLKHNVIAVAVTVTVTVTVKVTVKVIDTFTTDAMMFQHLDIVLRCYDMALKMHELIIQSR